MNQFDRLAKDMNLSDVSHAWKAGGSKSVALLLDMSPTRASSLISNLRRSDPEAFPRRARGRPMTQKQWRLRKAIELIEQGLPLLALPFIRDCLKPTKGRPKVTP